jgi:hypothetical protein
MVTTKATTKVTSASWEIMQRTSLLSYADTIDFLHGSVIADKPPIFLSGSTGSIQIEKRVTEAKARLTPDAKRE